jgi:hypothetical protein
VIAAAAGDPEIRPQLDPILQKMEGNGWGSLVAAIRRVIEGERDTTQALLAGLDEEDTLIVGSILAGIENPEAFRELLDRSSSPEPEA